VFEAMGLGALEAVDMPSAGEYFDQSAAPLVAKIDTVARLVGEGRGGPRVSARGAGAHTLVAIGASAGGPAAVAAVLAALPQDFPAAIAIVQHVDPEFLAGMAHWLSERGRRRVTVAADGDTLTPGRVLLAGGSGHLVIRSGGRVGYTAEPTQAAYTPSVDVFFTSVRRHWCGEAVAVLLTGMGRDGAAGLKALREHHVHTIAQDEQSSTVYGMPKAAAAMQAAVDILPLDRIASRLVELTIRPARASRTPKRSHSG
jgi:chemotaxis response regulator CheB